MIILIGSLKCHKEKKMEEKKEEKKARVLIPMTKGFRKEVKKRALNANVTMQDWIEMACVEKMLREDSYN